MKNTVKVLVLATAIVLASSSPVAAGTAKKDNPSGPYVTYTDANYTFNVRPLGVWFPIDIAFPGHPDRACHMRAKHGNLFNRGFTQLQYLGGTCKWGGIHEAYSYNGGLPSDIPLNGDYCVAITGSTNTNYCTQLSDGSIFLQAPGTAPNTSYLVQSQYVVCITDTDSPGPGVIEVWSCYHETDSIAF